MKSKFILGTAQFGMNYGINNQTGKPSFEQIRKVLDYAFDSSIKILDTAETYGDSQELIGAYHKNSENKFEVVTKFSSTVHGLPSPFYDRVEKNLKTLQVNGLYGYMFHSYQDFKEFYPAQKNEIQRLKTKKLIKKLGVSVYTNDEAKKALEFEDVDLIQLPFNALDNYSKRGQLLKEAKEKGVEIHARSAFLQGLFFKPLNKLTGNLQNLKPALKQLRSLCSAQNTMAGIALNYAYHQEEIDYVVIGVDNALQLQSNLTSVAKNISKEIITAIDTIDVQETQLLNPSSWRL